MSALHTLLHFTWALPQTLLGLIIRGLGHGEISTDENTKAVSVEWLKTSLFSLGRFIFYPSSMSRMDYLISIDRMHERGHSKQSIILGPLYIPTIAIPSVIWFYLRKWFKIKRSYYTFYTEAWANRLSHIRLI